MQTGQWICSVVSHQGTCYIRWVFVESWEAYRDALAEWFPGTPWEPSHHRVWFHVGHLTNLKARVETYIKTLLGNAGAWGDWRCGYYICNEIIQADTLRPKLFQELHAIVLDEVNADESGETLDAPHAYTHQCRMAYHYKPVEDTDVYDPEALLDSIHEAPLELAVEPSGCLQDPWDAEYPIVWKRETVKDLLVLAQRLNIPARSVGVAVSDASDAGADADASFWKVDDCFNLRSRSMKAVVKEHDIIRLFQWMGLNPAHLTGLREIAGGASGKTGTWEDYFALPLGFADDPMQPIEGYDRSGRLYFDFNHWTTGEDWLGEWRGLGTPPKKLAKEPAPERVRAATAEEQAVTMAPKKMVVRLYKNKITGAVQTMVKEPVVLLPEITLLYESPEYTEHEAAWLRLSFDSAPHTNQPTTLQTSLYEMKLAALGVDVSRLGWDGGKVNIGFVPSVPELTARSVLHHIIQHAHLTPTTVWTPSQELLEVFMGAIKKLNETHPGLQLQCQRNVLAVLLADLVPKRRFMTGQMFQMKKPSVADIEQALKTLPIPEPGSVGAINLGA